MRYDLSNLWLIVLAAPAVLIAGVALAQDPPPAEETPQTPPPTTAPPTTAPATPAAPTASPGTEAEPPSEAEKAPPSLDELLGLEPDRQSSSADEAAAREADEELKQHLSESEVRDAFKAALQKMLLSAELLDEQFDAGLGTQRVQEDILRKLDQLIEFAKQQQQQSSSSSSSSSSQQQQQQDQQQPGQQPERAEQQQQQASSQQGQQPSGSEAGNPPPRQEGDINTLIEETRSEWGNLPPRLRQELLQGRDDRYSRLYKRLTEEYYRRLAEDGAP